MDEISKQPKTFDELQMIASDCNRQMSKMFGAIILTTTIDTSVGHDQFGTLQDPFYYPEDIKQNQVKYHRLHHGK